MSAWETQPEPGPEEVIKVNGKWVWAAKDNKPPFDYKQLCGKQPEDYEDILGDFSEDESGRSY
jgi:hypothetical protein